MDKAKEIGSLYKILALYEDAKDNKSDITFEGYLNYIDKLYIKWLGIGDYDIYNTLKGLWTLGADAGHSRVKSTVFHMIGLIERGE